ncbi:single-strand DNA endonuclease ASTE1 isoform X2 [Salarias fasciatus]|uniref:single-strand DNA endonuclease ASTE1 isoform X2 n=1 Tax=Salarias fasciatus TaxID=181472 RepID=UPI001176AEDE|nr:protein asteroid homolog 1 isoform X2 [Salarias fasciatus]
MGVQGLTSLLEEHGRVLRDVKFRDSRLIIDGANLLHLLYVDSGLDQNHGGEYAAFEALLERFVFALRACRISPYVLLDGGSDPSNRKLQTSVERAKNLIRRADRAALNGHSHGILPPLASWVLKQTMARLQVPLAQCYGEADQEIAALATEWQCPVLSNDSDFFVFPLPLGLLPITHFLWEKVNPKDTRSYVPCKSYRTTSFCIYFQLRPELLPAFAALAGNDYIKLRQLDWSQWAPSSGGRLEGLLCWLRDFRQPDAALEAALRLLGEQSEESRMEVRSKLTMAMTEYQLPASVLGKFFLHGVAPPLRHTQQDLVGVVPDWMRLPLTRARLTSDVLDVLLLRRMHLRFTVETAELPNANLTSRPLRRLMYGLLLGRERPPVQEMDREGLQFQFVPVTPTVSSATQRLPLASLPEADPSERLQVLLGALGVTEASLSSLPLQLRLPLAVTCYWLQNAQPPPDRRLLQALLQGMLGNNKTAADVCQSAARHRRTTQDATHAFNQWQMCLRDALHLNQLLCFPLQEPDVAGLFQGTLVHQLLRCSNVRQKRPPPTVLHALAGLWEDEEDEEERRCFAQALEELEPEEHVAVKTRYKTKQRSNKPQPRQFFRKSQLSLSSLFSC